MNKKKLTSIISSIFLFFTISSTVLASETYLGTLESANTVINGMKSARNSADPMIVMERDFVFVDETGDYFFMPEIKRTVKTSCYKKDLRILGKKW